MKNYPLRKNPGKPKIQAAQFDDSGISAFDRELLSEFTRRRNGFEKFMEESSIIYHKHTCPACGYPSLDDVSSYETCVVCLWENDGKDDQQNLKLRALPNSISPARSKNPIRAFAP